MNHERVMGIAGRRVGGSLTLVRPGLLAAVHQQVLAGE